MTRRTIFFWVLFTKIPASNFFEALKEGGTVGRESGIGVRNFHGHGKVHKEFLDYHVIYEAVGGTMFQKLHVNWNITVRQKSDGGCFFGDVINLPHVVKRLQ